MDTQDGRLTKREIADGAGVLPPAVNNWETRHADFPPPADPRGRYAIDEIAAWLATRKIPSNGLLPGEPAGTTYGERFARNLGLVVQDIGRTDKTAGTEAPPRAVSGWMPASTVWHELDKRRGTADPQAYETLTLLLLHLRRHGRAERFATLAGMARSESPDGFRQALTSALAEHARRYPVLDESAQHIPRGSWTGKQLAETVEIIERACAGGNEDVLPTMTRSAAVCRFLLDRFATADGVRGVEFGTPDPLVRLMVQLLDPRPGDRIYDPACGPGSFLVGAAAHVEGQGNASQTMRFSGEALSERSLRLAKLNLDIHGLATVTELRQLNPLRNNANRGRFDVILSNPPFNMTDWSHGDPADDPRWRLGPPPRTNANFAWLQHVVGKLSPRGRAAVLMPNSAGVSANERERRIREAMIGASVVDSIIMLPAQLFRSTAVPVTLWLLRNPAAADTDHVQFIDARTLGAKPERGHRILTDEHIDRIVSEYRDFQRSRTTYAGQNGFAATATRAHIEGCDYALAAGRYVSAPPRFDHEAEQNIHRLREDLQDLHDRAARVDAVIDRKLSEVLG